MRELVALGCVLAALGCGDDERLPPADAARADAPVVETFDAATPDALELADAGCIKLWDRIVIGGGGSASATIESGALVLAAATLAQGSPLAVRQSGLTGDFDAMFSYEQFVPGGDGAYIQAAVSEDVVSPAEFASAAVGTYPVAGVSAGFQGGVPDLDSQAGTTNAAGMFRFERVGGELTVTATNGTTSASRTATFDAATLRIGVQIGSNHGAVAGATSIRITSFTLTGGGATVQGDEFECDTLR